MKSGPDAEVTFAYYFTVLTLTATGNKGELASLYLQITVIFLNF